MSLNVPNSGKSHPLQVHSPEDYSLSTSHRLRLLNNEYSEIHPQQTRFISHSLSSGLNAAKKGFQCIINTYTCLVGLLPRLIPLKQNKRTTMGRLSRTGRSARVNINKQKIKKKLHRPTPSSKPVYLTKEDKVTINNNDKINNTYIKRLLKVRSGTCKALILQGLKDCSIGPPARVHRSPSPLINTSSWSRDASIAALSSPSTSLAECFRLYNESMKTDEQQEVVYQSNNSGKQSARRSATQTQHMRLHNTVSSTNRQTPRLDYCTKDSAHASKPLSLRRILLGACRDILLFFRAHFRQWRRWNAWAAAPTYAGALACRLSFVKTSTGGRAAAAAQSRFERTQVSTWHFHEGRAAAIFESVTRRLDQFLSRIFHTNYQAHFFKFGSGLCTRPIVYVYKRGTSSLLRAVTAVYTQEYECMSILPVYDYYYFIGIVSLD